MRRPIRFHPIVLVGLLLLSSLPAPSTAESAEEVAVDLPLSLRHHWDAADANADGIPLPPSYPRPFIFRDLAGSNLVLQISNGPSEGYHTGSGTTRSPYAIEFDGETSFAHAREAVPLPETYAVAVWFRTTALGGKLLAFEDAELHWEATLSGPSLWIDDAGYLLWSADGAGSPHVASPGPVTDGAWHLAVGVRGPGGIALHLDGVRVGERDTEPGETFDGFWRLGAGVLADYPRAGAREYFEGGVASLRVFDRPLTGAEVAALHANGASRTTTPGAIDRLTFRFDARRVLPTLGTPNEEYDIPLLVDLSGWERHGRWWPGQASEWSGLVGNGSAADPRALSFDGYDDHLVASLRVPAPGSVTLSAWVLVRAEQGMILGFEDTPWGLGSEVDRHLWFPEPGRLAFGTGTTRIAARVDLVDGLWHHVAASAGPEGRKLWVDGALVAEDKSTAKLTTPGWWRLGGGSIAGWAREAGAFNGSIARAEVHSRALPPEEIETLAADDPGGRPPLPDLRVVHLQTERGTEHEGVPARVTVSVANLGEVAAAPSKVEVRIDGTAHALLDLPALPPGDATIVTSEPLLFPPGERVLSAHADPARALRETVEGNNAASVTVVVLGRSAIVVPLLLEVDPPQPRDGEAIGARLRVRNDGAVPSGPVAVVFREDGVERGRVALPALAPSAVTTVRSPLWVVAAGLRNVSAEVVAAGAVASSHLRIEAGPPARPNLAVASAWLDPAVPSLGDALGAHVLVRNEGDSPSRPARVRFLLAGAPAEARDVPALAPGEAVTLAVPLGPAVAGRHEVRVELDTLTAATPGAVLPRLLGALPWVGSGTSGALRAALAPVDARATDDAAVLRYALDPPEAEAPAASGKPNLLALAAWREEVGDRVRFHVAVVNDGGPSGPFLVAFQSGNQRLGSALVEGLAPKASATVTTDFVAGIATLTVRVDPRREVAESDEGDNVAVFEVGPRPTPPPGGARLVLVHVLPSPLAPAPGDPLGFIVRVENRGGEPTGEFTVRFLLDDVEIGSAGAQSLAPGAVVDLAGPTWRATAGRHVVAALVGEGTADLYAAASFSVAPRGRDAFPEEGSA